MSNNNPIINISEAYISEVAETEQQLDEGIVRAANLKIRQMIRAATNANVKQTKDKRIDLFYKQLDQIFVDTVRHAGIDLYSIDAMVVGMEEYIEERLKPRHIKGMKKNIDQALRTYNLESLILYSEDGSGEFTDGDVNWDSGDVINEWEDHFMVGLGGFVGKMEQDSGFMMKLVVSAIAAVAANIASGSPDGSIVGLGIFALVYFAMAMYKRI